MRDEHPTPPWSTIDMNEDLKRLSDFPGNKENFNVLIVYACLKSKTLI